MLRWMNDTKSINNKMPDVSQFIEMYYILCVALSIKRCKQKIEQLTFCDSFHKSKF